MGALTKALTPAGAGRLFAVRVTTRARRAGIAWDAAGRASVAVTVAPEQGRANEVVRRILAEALGVAPSRLSLVRGSAAATSCSGLISAG